MRDTTEAHYLHQRTGLEPVLRPPVVAPTVVAWIPGREELLACARDGVLHSVDPVLGTRVVESGLGEVSVLAIHNDRSRYLAVNREGSWRIGRVSGGVLAEGKHPMLGGFDGFWLGDYGVFAGDDTEGRFVLIVAESGEKARIAIPPRSNPIPGPNGKLALARSTPAGLVVTALARNISLDVEETTSHRLRWCGDHVIGVTATGVCVWKSSGGASQSMRLPDLSSGDISPAGDYLGLGTRSGAVALASIARLDGRTRPHLIKAFEAPVTSLAFSRRGRWLATAAEALRIWTWEG